MVSSNLQPCSVLFTLQFSCAAKEGPFDSSPMMYTDEDDKSQSLILEYDMMMTHGEIDKKWPQ